MLPAYWSQSHHALHYCFKSQPFRAKLRKYPVFRRMQGDYISFVPLYAFVYSFHFSNPSEPFLYLKKLPFSAGIAKTQLNCSARLAFPQLPASRKGGCSTIYHCGEPTCAGGLNSKNDLLRAHVSAQTWDNDNFWNPGIIRECQFHRGTNLFDYIVTLQMRQDWQSVKDKAIVVAVSHRFNEIAYFVLRGIKTIIRGCQASRWHHIRTGFRKHEKDPTYAMLLLRSRASWKHHRVWQALGHDVINMNKAGPPKILWLSIFEGFHSPVHLIRHLLRYCYPKQEWWFGIVEKSSLCK